jgi:hypothetical protein
MSNAIPLSVVWSDFAKYYERTVSSAEEASNLARDLQRANTNPPAIVEFFEPQSGKAFSIGVGRTDTVVMFQESLDPPYYISLGCSRDDGITSFCAGNEDTEFLNQNVVPFAAGVDALISFVRSRERPSNVEWECL